MPIPVWSAQAFAAALQALMPPGRVWPRDPNAIQTKVLNGLSEIEAETAARASNLVIDAFPGSTIELLPEWEETFGLPDPCAGLSPTTEARRNQVVARLTATGGQSMAYFVAFALALGYAVTIIQFVPSRFGRRFGMPFGGDDWAFTWCVNAPQFAINKFRFGTSSFGEPFASWGNDVLLCELERFAPAHTILQFSFSE